MSKFNTKYTVPTTVNHENHPAYSMNSKDHLITAVLTSLFGEPKYYGSTDDGIISLATDMCKTDPHFVYNLACYARKVMHLRSVTHALAAVIAHEAKQYTRLVIRNVVERPDDITEIMACYKTLYGKPFPNAMKREIGKVITKFDEYSIAKYNGDNKDIKFKDMLKLVHPVPKTEQENILFNKIINDTLETPYTWEVELSKNGNNKETWDKLIASGKLGYMAMLRNLRNMIKCNADIRPVLNKLSDKEEVLKSKQLPFRFYSAYKMLDEEGLLNIEVSRTLEEALEHSICNMPVIKGKTLIAVDVSGSMCDPISAKSKINCCDIAAVLGGMAAKICEDAEVCYFDAKSSYHWGGNKDGYIIKRYGKYSSILKNCLEINMNGGGTDLVLPMEYLLTKADNTVPFDRVIYFSDNEINANNYWREGLFNTVQKYVDQYRKKFNRNFWVHGVDMQGYGTQQFCGEKFNIIAGWGETVLDFINLAENGMSTLTKRIENYETE